METNIKKERAIAAGSVIFLLASLIGTGVFYNSTLSLKKNLNEEKLKTELMLSEKLNFEKDIVSFKTELNDYKGKNEELDKVLASTQKMLEEKEAMVKSITSENANVKSLKKQIADFNKLKKDFESQASVLNESIKKLNSEKEVLNNTIASLKEENKMLAANLDVLTSLTADSYLVESTKKNGKLTVISKRTKKMTLTFKVPQTLNESISFRIVKPDGTQVEGSDKAISFKEVNDSYDLYASISPEEIKVFKKIEMTYEPKEKLKAGLYKVEMLNAGKYMGSCNVKLR